MSVIQKLAFHLPHVRIIGNHYCGNKHRGFLKYLRSFQYVLCCCYYAERVLASFAHQIKSEYYGGNISMFIEDIVLDGFNASTQPLLFSAKQS